jgi:hypothetical protein
MRHGEYLGPLVNSLINYSLGMLMGWWTWGRRPASPRKEAPTWDE